MDNQYRKSLSTRDEKAELGEEVEEEVKAGVEMGVWRGGFTDG